MIGAHARGGRIAWIGLRPERRGEVTSVDRARIGPEGLEGDHGRPGKRAVTLIQAEHLPVIAALAGREATYPLLRRNIAVSGLNLLALRKATIRVGSALLRIEGPCAPCSRMEEALGPGGFNAVRGHGGWCASVVEPAAVAVGDEVRPG
ncbi:MOSC domain-containing protein [Wenxinia saemankumensis]|nr:MOSC domain-containing protein [Wenxinia saemankumensis]